MARYGIVSDIHANLEAARAAFGYLENATVDKVLCLGDTVGYGAATGECVELIRRWKVIGQQGNHEAALASPDFHDDATMRWESRVALALAHQQVAPETLEYLFGQPQQPSLIDDRLLVVHGALTCWDEYVQDFRDVDRNLRKMIRHHPTARICFHGHTHVPLIASPKLFVDRIASTTTFRLDPDLRYLVNPGSVGQPRDLCPMASLAVYDSDESTITIVRLPYNVAAEQHRMQAAGLPDSLWMRVQIGQ